MKSPNKNMTVIRKYDEKDREQIIELWKTCNLTRPWNDPNKDFDRKKGYSEDLFIVLEYENKVIGTVMGGYDGHRGIMNYLAVSPNFRGKGFGNKMIDKCLAFAIKSNFTKCYIETMPNMISAQKLYLKKGFEYIDKPMGNTGHTACPVWMLKDLK